MTTGPTVVWAQGPKPQGQGLDIGCALCVFEGNDVPADRVYFWGGASYCSRHLKGLQTNA